MEYSRPAPGAGPRRVWTRKVVPTIFKNFFSCTVLFNCAWDARVGPWLGEPNLACRVQPSPLASRPSLARLPELTWDLPGLCWCSCKLSWAFLGKAFPDAPWSQLELDGAPHLDFPTPFCALLAPPWALLGSPEVTLALLRSPGPAWSSLGIS